MEEHKGCDILDIHPGAGLWSQKLHDFLQPRRHVLMEPSNRYLPFLEPLLNAPDSKYTLVQKDTIELESYSQLVKEDVFPEQTRVDPNDTGRQELNKTLLVTGSLAWYPILPGMAFDSMAKQLYNHFCAAARTNDYFHSYGRVRMLFWVSADDFKHMLPESAANRSKNHLLFELTQNTEVIVSPSKVARSTGRASSGREPQYEIESMVQAMQRARANGLELPESRQDIIQKIAREIEKESGGSGRSNLVWLHDYLLDKHKQGTTPYGLLPDGTIQLYDDQVALQKKYPDVDFAAQGNARDKSVKRTQTFWKGREDHPARAEAHSISLSKTADRHKLAVKESVEAIADVGEELYFTECRALRLQDGTPEKEELMKQVTELDQKWDKLCSSVPKNYKIAPLSTTDDRISLRGLPYPRFEWDRRAFEPLIMSSDEVWPPHGLQLLSSTPLPRPAGQTLDFYEWVQDFVYALLTVPTVPLPEALEKMQHGLSDIVEKCPSLTDPDKGGRMLMKHFRCRMVTSEMVDELVAAYRDWPFKEPGSDNNKYFRWKGTNRAGDFISG